MDGNPHLNQFKSENDELDITKFQEYKDYRQFTRKPEDSFISFIAEYEDLVSKIQSTICDKNIQIFELLLACNLDSDDVETIFENFKNDKTAITYTAVKSSILEIAAELDQLEDNNRINDDEDANQDFDDETGGNVSDKLKVYDTEIRNECETEKESAPNEEFKCKEEEVVATAEFYIFYE